MATINDGYPVVLRLRSRRVLVVGAGPVAARKIEGLLEAGATVTVVAPQIDDRIRHLAEVVIVERPYEPSDLDGARLVIVSTNDASVQQQVFDDCEAAGIWCNAADDPQRCSFILPALARRGPVIVAVSTQGSSPALAGVLRDQLAEALPDNVEAVAGDLARRRSEMQAAGESTESVDWKPLVRTLLRRRPQPPAGYSQVQYKSQECFGEAEDVAEQDQS